VRKSRLGEKERGRLLRFARNDLHVIKLRLSQQPAPFSLHSFGGGGQHLLASEALAKEASTWQL
jgi:hypothetical protein